MAESWHDCIADELDEVEKVMVKVTRSENPELREMCQYVLSNHGKRIRPAICLLAFHACGGEDVKRAVDVGAAIEIIHNATLVHDDIDDQGELRRGAKALYRAYSLSKSVVAGDYMFAAGFRLLGATTDDIVDFVIEAASGLAVGEFNQKKYERNVVVDEDEYMRIISGKTARLIECAAKCGSYIADPKNIDNVEAAGNFAFKIGQAFQIVDDILDVTGDVNNTGKRVGNDLVEGKPTIPIIYGMQDPERGARIREIFTDPSSDYDDAREAIELIKGTDSIQRCRAMAERIAGEAKQCIAGLPDSVYKRSLMDLGDFIVSRDR